MQEIEAKIGYKFKNQELFTASMRHSSYANEHRKSKMQSNERLEFLGDSVLGFVVARHLFATFPDMPEGKMTKMRAELVCEQSLHRVAVSLGLGKFLQLGKGEENTGGRSRPSILADCVEALIAAIYTDGGIDVAAKFIHKMLIDGVDIKAEVKNSDFKTEFQELIQRKPMQTIAYEIVSETGPDHCKIFTSHVKLNGKVVGIGEGNTKKEAEQSAAKHALEGLQK